MKPAVAILACAACVASARPVEVVALPPSPPPGPYLLLRDTLDGCARDQGLVGQLRVRIEFDPDGGAGTVVSGYGDAFDACIGRSIMRARYRAYAGRTIEVPFSVSG